MKDTPSAPSRGAGSGRNPPANNGQLPCSNSAALAASLPRPTNPAQAAAAAAATTIGRVCPWDNPCPVHQQQARPRGSSPSSPPSLEPYEVEGESDTETDLFEAVMRLSLK